MLLAMQDIILATREKEVRNHDYGSNHRPSLQPTMSSSQSAKFASKIKNTVGKIRIYILVSFPSSYKLIKLQLRVRNGKTFSPKNKKSKISPDQFPRCYVLLSSEEKNERRKEKTLALSYFPLIPKNRESRVNGRLLYFFITSVPWPPHPTCP